MDKDHPEYNYRVEPDIAANAEPEEVPGVSCFLRDGGQVFHTYSTYARGTDTLGGSYSLLDLTALGRSGRLGAARGPGAPAARRGPDVHRLN